MWHLIGGFTRSLGAKRKEKNLQEHQRLITQAQCWLFPSHLQLSITKADKENF